MPKSPKDYKNIAYTLTLKTGKTLRRQTAPRGGLLFPSDACTEVHECAEAFQKLRGKRTAILEWLGQESDGSWTVLGTIKYYSKSLSR